MASIFWNCRGAAKQEFLNSFKEVLRVHKPIILVLVEPRVHGSKAFDIVRQSGFDKVEKVEARGFAEGLWLFWNTAGVNLEIIEANHQSITSILRRPGDALWVLTSMYASPYVDTQKYLWDHITRIEPHVLGSWVIASNMNVVINRTEKTGAAPLIIINAKPL